MQILVILLTCFVSSLHPYNILVFNPRFGKSHVLFMNTITDTLIEAGHNLTQFITTYKVSLDATGSKLAKKIEVDANPKISQLFEPDDFAQNAWEQKYQSALAVVKVLMKWSKLYIKQCEYVLSQKAILDELKTLKFDLAILEFEPCALGIIELLEIPAYVAVSAVSLMDSLGSFLGMPVVPSYVPDNLLTPFTDQMTYSQRLFNFASVLFMKCWFKHVIRNDQKIFQRLYGENFIDLEEKLAQATFVLESSNPFFNIPKPTIYKVLELGGLGIPKAQPLSDASCICIHIISEWSKVMNENKKVILVSFGTVAFSYLMPNETKQALLQTFNEFSEVIFIWKYEKEEDNIAEGYPNVITAKWLPQTDLLAHPNLVAFLTHGGMNSIMQTLSFGKPVIVVPLFMDQLQNAALIQRSRTGILLQLSKLIVKQKLRQAIHEIIYNTMYLQNAKRISEMMAKRPNPAKEQLIRHVEFAAEFGQIPNFDPYGRKLSFVTYYMLDIIIPCIFVIFCIISGICWLIFSILRKLYRKLIQNNQCIAVENGEKKNQ